MAAADHALRIPILSLNSVGTCDAAMISSSTRSSLFLAAQTKSSTVRMPFVTIQAVNGAGILLTSMSAVISASILESTRKLFRVEGGRKKLEPRRLDPKWRQVHVVVNAQTRTATREVILVLSTQHTPSPFGHDQEFSSF